MDDSAPELEVLRFCETDCAVGRLEEGETCFSEVP